MRVWGGTVSRKSSSFKSGAAMIVGAVQMILLAAGTTPVAAAAEEPSGPARIVFSNGGRIVRINADGTDRKVLTNRNRKPKNGPYGHTDPKVSPDGTMMLFTDNRRVAKGSISRSVVVARADGTDRKVLLNTAGRFRYSTATWMPDGSVLAPYFEEGGKFFRAGLLKIRPDGSGRHKVFELKPHAKKRWAGPRELAAPAVSPDGTKALVTISDDEYGPGPGRFGPGRLVVVDLATGRQRKVADDGFSGAWSPDGSLIVYTAGRLSEDDETCSWRFGCEQPSAIMVAEAKGGPARRLIPGSDDQRLPSFSPDGSRVLFQSNRNLPGVTESNEIYSVRPDGKCLTWLTNGTPASTTPSWVPDPVASSAPEGCGPLGLVALPEATTPHPFPGANPLWVGSGLGSLLYSSGFSSRAASMVEYMDCGTFRFADCGKPFVIWTLDICSFSGSLALGFTGDQFVGHQRGVPVFRSRIEGGILTSTFAGRSSVMFLGGSKGARKEIAALRPVGAERAVGDLPKPLFPRKDLRRMKKVVRVVKRSGTVRVAAKRLGMKPRVVQRNVKMSRILDRIGRYGVVNCPAKKPRGQAATSVRNGFPGAG